MITWLGPTSVARHSKTYFSLKVELSHVLENGSGTSGTEKDVEKAFAMVTSSQDRSSCLWKDGQCCAVLFLESSIVAGVAECFRHFMYWGGDQK